MGIETGRSDQGGGTRSELNPMPLQEPSQLGSAERCGARTRSGRTCRQPKVSGRARCRLHGGAHGSGAPSGERNGKYQDGHYTKEARAERRWLTQLMRQVMRKSR